MLNLSKIASRVAILTEPKTCDGCGFPARSSLILNSQGDASICPMCSDIENFHKTGEREPTQCPLSLVPGSKSTSASPTMTPATPAMSWP